MVHEVIRIGSSTVRNFNVHLSGYENFNVTTGTHLRLNMGAVSEGFADVIAIGTRNRKVIRDIAIAGAAVQAVLGVAHREIMQIDARPYDAELKCIVGDACKGVALTGTLCGIMYVAETLPILP